MARACLAAAALAAAALGNAALAAGPGRGADAAAGGTRPPAVFEGVSLDVQDGDSFVAMRDDGTRLRVRINGIDAPERGQPFADRSRQHLRGLLRDTRIRVEAVKLDRFDRVVARVWRLQTVDGPHDIGLAQIEAGLAWHFTRYRADQTAEQAAAYARAERAARQARVGLWLDEAPQAPWAFRATQRRDESTPAPALAPRP
jgi:endonuclease YncB( thermonuclease family)